MTARLKLIFRILILVVWSIGLMVFHQKGAYQEVHVDQLPQTYRFFSDSAFGGISTCEHVRVADTNFLKYTLIKKGDQYTFTNLVIVLDEDLDVSGYDNFEYTLKGDYLNKLRLFMVMNIPEDTVLKSHTIEYFKEYGKEYEVHTVPLNDFVYHEYWLRTRNVNEKELGPFNFKNTKALIFGSGSRIVHGRTEEIAFHSIKFTKTVHWPYYVFLGFLVLLLFYWWILRFLKKKEEIISIDYSARKDGETDEVNLAVQFMTKNYMNPLISVAMVCDELCISEAKLSADIKKGTTLNFKLLLNQLRISESKRLLINTDLLVSEIAELVGYENTTHFNRIFKTEVNRTPSDYRKPSKRG
jgi:AraC-like DNA-binding protein